MMNKFREIISEKLRLSGIRGCMAAGAITAGIAALAVIGGINSDDISTVSLETDVIPEETASAEAISEKKTYSHDMEYFTLEDIRKMTSETEEDSSENKEINEAALPANTETEEAAEPPEMTESNDIGEAPEDTDDSVSEEPEEEPAPSEEETVLSEEAAYGSDETVSDNENVYEDISEITEDISENTEDISESSEEIPESIEDISENSEDIPENNDNETEQPEGERENTQSVAARSSAAGGEKDDGGLSSALDLEIEDSAEADDPDDFIIVYSSYERAASDEAAAEEPYNADEELNDIPEDITLDDGPEESEESTSAPQEDAISLLELPEWLTFDENGIPTEYVTVLTGDACAYTAEPDALMSTGREVFQGYVAVDPDVIPYGSELYIVAEDGEVYGYAIAADTGYSVSHGHIIVDLFMNDYDECIQWGNKPVYVYVLK